MKNRVALVTALTLTVGLLFAFQNCSSRGRGPGPDNTVTTGKIGAAATGNGGSYDGKPKAQYVELDRTGTCGSDTTAVKSEIVVQEDGSAFYVKKDCVEVSPIPVPAPQDETLITADAPDILTTEGRLFEEVSAVATNPFQSAWACRTRIELEGKRHARVTIRVVRKITSQRYFSSINYDLRRDSDNSRVSLRKSSYISMAHDLWHPIASYQDRRFARGTIRLNIDVEVKRADLKMSFLHDPKWILNTDNNPATMDQDVLSPLGKINVEAIKCFGDELK